MAERKTRKIDKKWISFGTLLLGAGTIYKLGFLKDAFYVPMQEFMGLSHTQIGTAMSVAGLISTFGFLASKSQPPLQVVVWVGPHKGRLHARPKGRVSQALLLVRL